MEVRPAAALARTVSGRRDPFKFIERTVPGLLVEEDGSGDGGQGPASIARAWVPAACLARLSEGEGENQPFCNN